MDFYFGVPLRSRASSRDWGKICSLFEATLSSLLHQSDGNFEVIVACHDVPETALLRDPRVTVVQADFAPPADFPAQMVDKGRKKQMIARTVGDRGGGYLMMVDADDLVSRRLVDFVHRDRDPHGYVFKTGFELDHASGRVRAAPRFNNLCGTSAIIHFSADDLPTSRTPDRDCYFGRFGGHPQWEGVARAANRPLKPLPFPGAMYVVNHSQNHSVAAGNIGWKRRLYRLAFPGKKLSAPLSQDFTIAPAWA